MFHSRLCLLNEGAAPRELSPVLAPNDNRDAPEPTHQSRGTDETWPEAAESGGTFWRFWHRGLSGMPALCPPVVCSLPARGYSQLFLVSMGCGLTTPPFMQVLPKKRPNSCGIRARALLRCVVCSHDDAVLVAVVWSFRIGVPAIARNCARELHKLVRRHALAVRTEVVRFGR